MVSLGDTANSLHILQLPPGEGEGGVLPKVGFGFREENWSLEIWGGGVLSKVGFGLGEENWSLEFVGGGVFCQRSDLD